MRKASSALLLLCLLANSCAKPKRLEDPKLARGFALVSKDPNAALKEFSQVRDQKSERRHYGEGLAHEALGDLKAATASYDKALGLKQAWTPAQIARARVQILQGDIQGAHKRLDKWVSQDPSDLQALSLYAMTARDEEQRIKAEQVLSRWTGLAPKTPGATVPAEFYLIRGEVNRSLARKEATKKDLRRGSDSRLGSRAGTLALARLAAGLGKKALARSLLERIAREDLTAPEAGEVVSLALKLKQLKVAKVAAQKIPVFPEDALNFLVLGRVRVATEQSDQAIAALSKCMALLSPQQEKFADEARFLMAQALLQKGQAKKAEPHLLALEKAAPGRLSVQLLLAQAEAHLGESEAAAVRLKKLVLSHPASEEAGAALVSSLVKAGDLEGAETHLLAAIEKAPKNSRVLGQLVQVLKAAEKFDLLETQLTKLSQADPKNARTLGLWVDLLLDQKRKAEALEIAAKRADKYPESEALALLVASMHEVLGNKEELLQVLKEITARFPESAAAWHSLAQVEEASRHFAEAEAALIKSLELNADNRRARSHLAAHYMREKKYEAAAKQYEKVLRLKPKDPIALNNLAGLYLEHQKRNDDAVSLAERAVAVSSNPAFLDTLAWALIVQGKPQDRERALSLAERAYKKLKDPELQMHLAVAYFVSDKKEQATELLKGLTLSKEKPGHVIARDLMGM